MPKFSGSLRPNELFAAIYNMIISQQVFSDNIKGVKSQLVDKARTDGTLYGDQKLYYATDALKSAEWGNDAEATNLLALHRPKAPECQAIILDKFRQISLTTDNYLSKRAWGDEGTFSSFNSVMKGWVSDTKRIYDATTYNAFFGTCKAAKGRQNLTITIDKEAGAPSEAQQVAEYMANLFEEMTDISRDFNDYGFLRSYNYGDIKVVWNSKALNKIKKIDLPTIFHKDELMDKFSETLPSRYFGEVIATASEVNSGKGNGKDIRTLVEKDYGTVHCFPGDLIPNNQAFEDGEAYQEKADILCKVYVKLPPFMSSFEVGTSFFNPKSLTENNYLTWGHNTLEKLDNYPFITIKKA